MCMKISLQKHLIHNNYRICLRTIEFAIDNPNCTLIYSFDDIAEAYQHPAESIELDETDAILKGILNNPAVTQDFKVCIEIMTNEFHQKFYILGGNAFHNDSI